MDGFSWIASAAGFAFATTATPGPNNAMVAASGASFGLRRTVPHMLGVAVGFPLLFLLVALGASELLRANPALEWGMRWAGAAWMLWLAWRIATAEPAAPAAGPAAPGEGGRAGRHRRPMRFLEAAAFQWVNPKAWAMAAAGIAAYATDPGTVLERALVLALLFGVMAVVCLAAWAALGAGMARLLLRPAAVRWFNRGMAALLVLSIIPLLAAAG
jgi:threonine/homoserine/homoserine lactone efflux protein